MRDKTARNVAFFALSITLLTFLFGDNIAGRLYYKVYPFQQGNKTLIEGIIALLNVGLAVFVLVDIRFIRPVPRSSENTPASNSYKQLLWGWQALWFTWVLFYGCLAAQWLKLIGDGTSDTLWQISDGLNMVNGFFFYYLFFVLDQPSVPTKEEPNRAKAFRFNWLVTLSIGFILFIISAAISGLIKSAGRKDVEKLVLLPKLVPAYIAVGMAFFFGRLDSHYLRLPRVILAPFYLYAIIQLFWERSTFVDISIFSGERVAIFSIALVLKFAVFLTLSNLIGHESFRKYFVVAEEGLRES
jgi:hypothetical protein